MSVARHGDGVGAAVRALASQIHPVFMLPPVAASAFGAVLAEGVAYTLVLVHLGVVFCGLYTAHIKDGYVDFHRRAEDDDHPLTERGCWLALALSTLGFAAGTAVLGVLVGPFAALLCLPGWLIGYLHAPQLDTHPVGATVGYPTGIALALLGGYYVQARTFSATVLAFAALFLVILAGIKIIDDATDHDYDRTIGKRTVAVALGPPRARRTAYGLMALGLAGVVAFSVTGIFPPSSVGSVAAFAVVAAVARRAGDDDELATMLLVRASYLFLAVLVVAVWLQPLS
jgi:1,4-dihydroxy-2-naphthoate octaprenyltransferase